MTDPCVHSLRELQYPGASRSFGELEQFRVSALFSATRSDRFTVLVYPLGWTMAEIPKPAKECCLTNDLLCWRHSIK